MSLSAAETERYSRNLLVREIGPAGQEKLKKARVLVIGAGGLGSPVCYYLAAAGVGTIGIADGDAVDLSNLQRQILHRTSSVGELKVKSAQQSLHDLNPLVEVITHHVKVDRDNIQAMVAPYDIVIDATDNFAAKFLINDGCVAADKPFVHGAVIRFNGQVMTYVPGKGPCYRCVFPEMPPEGSVPLPANSGVVGSVVGIIGSLQATEAIKFILGAGDLLVGQLLIVDALTMNFERIGIPRDANCPVCGHNHNPSCVTV